MKTKTIMVIFAILFSVNLSTLMAQTTVKIDLMKILEQQPQPPATSKEALAKVTVSEENGNMTYSAAIIFASTDGQISQIEAEYAAQPKASPGNIPTGSMSSSDRKKMKGMSKEEKMKMAMEMMQTMPGGAPVAEMEPPAIRAALDEWQKIYNDTQQEFQRAVVKQQEEAKLADQYQKAHAEVDSWQAAEVAKLPRISSGETSAPDQLMLKAVNLKAADKHIAVADKRLEQIRARWQTSVEQTKVRYSAFYKKLVAANYAADSKNFSTRKILSDAQMMILSSIKGQIEQSRSAWVESASWQGRKKQIK